MFCFVLFFSKAAPASLFLFSPTHLSSALLITIASSPSQTLLHSLSLLSSFLIDFPTMADQEKKDQPQAAAPQTQEPDITKSEQPTATESAPAPEPATEPTAATTAPAAEAAPAAPEPSAATAAAETPAATSTEPAQPAAPEATKSEAQPEASGKEEKKNEPSKPEYFTKTPALEQLFDRLPGILSKTGHQEMWGVPLKHDASDIPTINVLIKFLRANEGNLKLAEEQLTKALEWRKENDPVALVKSTYDAAKFGGLGYLTTYAREGKGDLIVTWNIYGAVKKIDDTFGNITEYVLVFFSFHSYFL